MTTAFEVVAEPARREILDLLIDGPRPVGELVGATGLHAALVSLSLPSWDCPFFRLTGIPCPGCGLSRATLLLLKGDLTGSLRFHAFAPIFLFARYLGFSGKR